MVANAIRNVPMDLLRSFVLVAEKGGFGKAGRLLGRSQPAISLQLKRLEEMVQAPLLRRGSRKLELTEAGETLLQYARQILLLNDELYARLVAPALDGTVRVGLPNDFAVSFLPAILGAFAREHDKAQIEVDCGLSRDLLEGLEAGRHDLVISICGSASRSFLAKSWPERVVWVGNAATLAVDPLPLVVYPVGCAYRARITQTLNRAGRAWRPVFVSAALSGLVAAVQAGLGITALSEKTVPPGLKALPALPDIEVGLYFRRDSLSKAGLALANHIIRAMDAAHG